MWFSLKIALVATLLGLVFALPLAWFIYRRSPTGKAIMMLVMQTWLAVPTVIIGTLVYLFISRSGPLGALEMLYTPQAIVVGDLILVTPLIAVFLVNSFEQVPKGMIETAINLGASSWQLMFVMLRECRRALAVAACAGFGRVIAEVGCAMMLGGNILNMTRTMTTAIALEIGKGETDLGLALGMLLLLLALGNAALVQGLQWLGSRRRHRTPSNPNLAEETESPGNPSAEPNAAVAEMIEKESIDVAPGRVRIQFHEVSMAFSGRELFRSLDWDTRPGKGLALTGPSGSGKTTILRLISGLVKPKTGSVSVEGGEVVLVFQRPYLFSGTIRENLEFGPWCRGASRQDRSRQAESVAADLGLSGMLDRSVDGLSGGEAARVALGRALAVGPGLLLLDEPMVHLDRTSRESMIRVLQKRQRLGGEMILVTHDPDLAKRLCWCEFTLTGGTLVPGGPELRVLSADMH